MVPSTTHRWITSMRCCGASFGIEITITDVEAKEKLSQNRPLADQQGVIDSLTKGESSGLQKALSGEIAQRMKANIAAR